ncbi:MAG: flippase [Bacteroidales bacterium]|nr:flippase [Bacteroidales bacterium]
MEKGLNTLKNRAKQNRTLLNNLSYLSLLQFFNLLLPLVTYPYLIRVLGKDTFGLVIFAQAIIGYLLIFVSFGFNISATKEISIHRNNKEKLNEIVSSILIIKGLLFLLSLMILLGLLLLIPMAKGHEWLFCLTMWICFYDLIFPIWYFQGIEQMKYITYLTLLSRLVFLGLIFLLIHSSNDYLLVPLINGIGSCIAGTVSLLIIFRLHGLDFKWQQFNTLKHYFSESVPIFISNLSSKIYVSTNKVIAGTFLSMADVAYYDLAEKIIAVFKIPQSILSQAFFPRISKEKNRLFIKKTLVLSLIINMVLFLILIIFSKHLILLLGGSTMLNATLVVNILAITVPVIAVSNVFGIQFLIPFGYNKTFSRIIIISGFLYLVLAFIIWLTTQFTIVNISVITVVTELFVTAYMFYYSKKYQLWN